MARKFLTSIDLNGNSILNAVFTLDTVTAVGATSTAQLWSNITTGSVGIGTGISGGTINIGTASISGNKAINIGTSNTGGTNTIIIGSSSGATNAVTINGPLTLSSALATGSGGTGLTSFTSGGAVYATSTSALTTGTLPISAGGTNSTATPTAGGIGYGTGTAHAYTAAGTAGTVVLSGGATAPTFTTGTLALAGNLSTVGANTLAITTTGATTVTLPTSGTLMDNKMTTIGDILYASATGTPATYTRLAGVTSTQPGFLYSVGNGTTNTTTAFSSSTGSGNVVLVTSPTFATSILGGTSMDVFNTLTTGTLNIGNAAGTVAIGGSATSLTIGSNNGNYSNSGVSSSVTTNFASGTVGTGGVQTINIGAGTVSAGAQTINIGTGSSVTSATRAINIGQNNAAGVTTTTFLGTVTVPTPINGTDAANKNYVDNVSAGVNAHDGVQYATTAALAVNYIAGGGTFASPSGTSGNNTLTISSPGFNLSVGQTVSGTGVPTATTITVVNLISGSGTTGTYSVTLSNNLTANASGSYTFFGGDGGTGVGATLTFTATGVQSIDGGANLVLGDRVLVKNGISGTGATGTAPASTANGIYVVTTAPAVGVAGILTRAADYDNSAFGDVAAGDIVYILAGGQAGSTYIQNTKGTATTGTGVNQKYGILIGTDAINFTLFSASISGTVGISQGGTGGTTRPSARNGSGSTGLSEVGTTLTMKYSAATPTTSTGVLVITGSSAPYVYTLTIPLSTHGIKPDGTNGTQDMALILRDSTGKLLETDNQVDSSFNAIFTWAETTATLATAYRYTLIG
jgi:hypothetical protein